MKKHRLGNTYGVDRRHFLGVGPLALSLAGGLLGQSGSSHLGLLGTYTRGSSKGIYGCRFDSNTGDLSLLGLVAETPSPSFIALSNDRSAAFAVNEINNYQGQTSGSVSSFRFDAQNVKLTPINTVSSHGGAPCHLALDRTGRCLFVANFYGGSIASYPLSDGKIGEAASIIRFTGRGVEPKLQATPHSHQATLSPDNRFLLINDFGIDQIQVFRFDPATAKVTPNNVPYWSAQPGAAPRHSIFHPSGKWLYNLNELACTVDVLTWNAQQGTLASVQSISTIPEDHSGKKEAAEIAVDRAGRFLYASQHKHESVTAFSIDQTSGKLTLVDRVGCGGRGPRYFTLDPSEGWLLVTNQHSGNIAIFRRDAATGKLTATGKSYALDAVVCLLFV